MITLNELQLRRQRLIEQMSDHSAMIIFSAPEKTRSADTEYPYRQDSDFWYLTQFNEPEAALVLLKDTSSNYRSILFNRVKDVTAEIWYGRRLGQEAAPEKLSVDEALPFDDIQLQLCQLLNNLNVIYHAQGHYRYADEIIYSVFEQLRKGGRQNKRAPLTVTDWRPMLHEMRLIKSPAELEIMRQAGKLNCKAHTRAMCVCQPGMFEYQLEAEILHEYAMSGARYPSYNTIVGGGENGCILHYTENESELRGGDLVLIDAGCEYQGYASDITRTFPVNGRFSPAQRAIYSIVLESQKVALANFKAGTSIYQVNQLVIKVMVDGLIRLGILQGDSEQLIADKAWFQFYMHGLGHWLGLDVHDVGDYKSAQRDRILEPGMVLTVEPGLYIAAHPNVPVEYHNIGVRIEDNIVITEQGNELLTDEVVKDPDAIEALMAKK